MSDLDYFDGAKVTIDLNKLLALEEKARTTEGKFRDERMTFLEVLRQAEVFMSFMYAVDPEKFQEAKVKFNSQSREARIHVNEEDKVKIQILPKEATEEEGS